MFSDPSASASVDFFASFDSSFPTRAKNLVIPVIPWSRKSPPWSNGAKNARYTRITSTPNFLIYSSGLTIFPRDLDIFAPSLVIKPCARNFLKGSSKFISPQFLNTFVINLAYIRCKTACSAPPIYICTGSHLRARHLSNGAFLFFVSIYLKKYQEESKNVSETSVSRFASALHPGHLTL